MSQDIHVAALTASSIADDSHMATLVNERLAKVGEFVAEFMPQLTKFIGELQDADWTTDSGEEIPGLRPAMIVTPMFNRSTGRAEGERTSRAVVDPVRVPAKWDRDGNPTMGVVDEMGVYRLADEWGTRIKKTKDGDEAEVGRNVIQRGEYCAHSSTKYGKGLGLRYPMAIYQLHSMVDALEALRCYAEGTNPVQSGNKGPTVTYTLASAIKALQSGEELSDSQKEAIAKVLGRAGLGA